MFLSLVYLVVNMRAKEHKNVRCLFACLQFSGLNLFHWATNAYTIELKTTTTTTITTATSTAKTTETTNCSTASIAASRTTSVPATVTWLKKGRMSDSPVRDQYEGADKCFPRLSRHNHIAEVEGKNLAFTLPPPVCLVLSAWPSAFTEEGCSCLWCGVVY